MYIYCNLYGYGYPGTNDNGKQPDDLCRIFRYINSYRGNILHLDTECNLVERNRKPCYGDTIIHHHIYGCRNG